MAAHTTASAGPAEGSRAWYEEKIPVKLFRGMGGKYQEDVFVAVNGKGWQIQRGVTVQIPRCVALVLEQSMEQDQRAAELMDREAGRFAAEAERLGGGAG